MPETPEGLLARLAAAGIETRTVTHPPVFTVAESQSLRGTLPGGHSKNLFLRPAKQAPGPYLLAVLEEDRQISVNALAWAAGAGRVEMAPAEALLAQLGVAPGSVTPFGMVNAAPGAVRMVIDAGLVRDHEWVHFHPLVNSMTTAIRPSDLLRFLEGLGHRPEVLDLPPPSA
ncbi:prolyl-tRNA synthetase associated domain-containing protein [Siccirubricoccus sp. KC 17139]|uniref:Prolyl-tRNA synthetase associated domain-containing protein n=1 Tax=Siccirubricoccus soli TaxID=2899147 RepID=A0ABT1DA86_9PROT|nr:prolyl-tRNA synthetase associated domain-containing protein [Siccirubricoccus soli]MCO6418838.1 prolyl-tRNA synthetase associated domain-containing protein [Siccirubricoccus soli]MCP2684973.1 prolyl-tRNA synthetase associated domain-containing protein [Siccirubricoccus soli]